MKSGFYAILCSLLILSCSKDKEEPQENVVKDDIKYKELNLSFLRSDTDFLISGKEIDIDNDGVNDINVLYYTSYISFSVNEDNSSSYIKIRPLNGNKFSFITVDGALKINGVSTTESFAKLYIKDDVVISSAGDWKDLDSEESFYLVSYSHTQYYNERGYFIDQSSSFTNKELLTESVYVAYRVKDSDNKYNYGWLKLSSDTDLDNSRVINNINVVSYAINNSKDRAIKTGQQK